MIDFFLYISNHSRHSSALNEAGLWYDNGTCQLYIEQHKEAEILSFENENTLKIWVGSFLPYRGFKVLWEKLKGEITIDKYEIDSLFRQINGVFALLSINKLENSVAIITDHLGFFPVYSYQDAETIICSSTLKHILHTKRVSLEWNQSGIEEYLRNGHFILNQCWYTEVRRISAATVYTIYFIQRSISKYNYWTWENVKKRSVSLTEGIEQYHELFKKSIDELDLPDEKLGISLSGGLDSRYISQCLHGTKKLESFTFSEVLTSDLMIARKVSEILTIPHRHLVLHKGKGFEDRIAAFINGDGMLHLGHLHESSVHKDIQELYNYYFHGFFGGGIYASKSESNKGIDDRTARNHFYFSSYASPTLTNFYNMDSIDPYIIDQKIRNQSAYSIKILSYLSKVIVPFYNMDWMEFNYSIPDEAQIHQNFYLKVLNRKLCTKLLDLPWQKTGIPVKYAWLNSQNIRWKIPGIREWMANQVQRSIHFISPRQLSEQDLHLIRELENEWTWFKNLSSDETAEFLIRKLSVAVWVKASEKLKSNAD